MYLWVQPPLERNTFQKQSCKAGQDIFPIYKSYKNGKSKNEAKFTEPGKKHDETSGFQVHDNCKPTTYATLSVTPFDLKMTKM